MIDKNNLPVCISLGPGEADLITLKALKALQESEVIYCPETQSDKKAVSRARDILIELGISKKNIRLFTVPMSKDRSHAEKVYDDVAQEIAEQYRSGVQTVFVAEGDAGFYSSVHYISDRLAGMNISVEHIAGVPAFIACGALAGIHVVKQEEPLLVFPANVGAEKIMAEVKSGKSVVLMKLSQQQEAIKKVLRLMPDAEFHYFENAGVAGKEFYTQNTAEILEREFPYFSLLIIKKNKIR